MTPQTCAGSLVLSFLGCPWTTPEIEILQYAIFCFDVGPQKRATKVSRSDLIRFRPVPYFGNCEMQTASFWSGEWMLQETCSARACVLNSVRQLALGVLLASRFPIQVDENDIPDLCWQSCFEFPWLPLDNSRDWNLAVCVFQFWCWAPKACHQGV